VQPDVRPRGRNRRLERGALLAILLLERDHAGPDGKLFLQGRERLDELRRVMRHDVAVGSQKRLALRAVHDVILDGALQLRVGGKPGAAAADHARLPNQIRNRHVCLPILRRG